MPIVLTTTSTTHVDRTTDFGFRVGRVQLRQRYPLNPIPWVVGEEMKLVDPVSLKSRGSATVTEVTCLLQTMKIAATIR